MKSKKKIKRILRQTLLSALCLVCVFSLVPTGALYAYTGESGYEWTRIHNDSEFQTYVERIDEGDGKITERQLYKSDQKLNTDSDWYRVLMIYENDGYFISGTTISGEEYVGQPIKASYDVKADQDTFTTRSGLGAPFLKMMGYDGKNVCFKCSLAFPVDDAPGPNCLIANASWYGCVEAGCYDMQFIIGPRSNPSSAGIKNNGWVSNVSVYPVFDMGFKNNKVYVKYNMSGVIDVGWESKGGGALNTDSTSARTIGDGCGFKLYIGKKTQVPSIGGNYTVQAGVPVVWDGVSVETGAQVTVEKGATLVIKGLVYNNGIILVDGGTLIIQGIMDTDVGIKNTQPFNLDPGGNETDKSKLEKHKSRLPAELCPGSILVQNNGQLIIEDTGTLLTRYDSYNGGSSLYVYDNSSAYISGICVLAQCLAVYENSTVRVAPGAFLACGAIPYETVKQTCYNIDWLNQNKSKNMDAVCQETPVNLFYTSNGTKVVHNEYSWIGTSLGIFVYEDSSLYCMGGVFLHHVYGIYCKEGGSLFAHISTNIHAPLSSMLWTTLE